MTSYIRLVRYSGEIQVTSGRVFLKNFNEAPDYLWFHLAASYELSKAVGE